MAKTVVGLYEDFKTAENVVRELENHGFPREDISLVAQDGKRGQELMGSDMKDTSYKADDTGSHAAAGAGTGAVVGGIAGLLVGVAALAIPGVGPIIAAGPLATALAGAGVGAVAGGLIGALTSAGVPEEEANLYAEGVRRGGTLVTVNSPDDMADQAADIMNRFDPIDIDTRAASWSDQSYGESSTTGDTGAWRTTDRSFESQGSGNFQTEGFKNEDFNREGFKTEDVNTEGERHIPIVEEEMRVGKRQVQRGGVRVHTVVHERPVEETHTVRDESVNVERRPVNRPATDSDFDNAFKEHSFEVTETDEELVADKKANVVEEVVVSKNIEERPETVRDTLRSTDVETENLDNQSTTTRDFGKGQFDYRNHYDTTYANMGHDYSYYEPAYQYGYGLRNMQNYRGRTWSEIEPQVRQDWERRYPQNKWEEFKDAIQHAWSRAK